MKLLSIMRRDKWAAVCFTFLSAVIAAGIFAPWFAPHPPEEVHMELRFAGASWTYWLGNDHLGRCVLSRLIYGIRPSVLWVLAALSASVAIGAFAGFAAGYFRGKTDVLLMRLCDVMLSFPGYVMTLAVIGIMGPGLEHILIAFVLMKWAWFARIIRTSVLQYSNSDYVRFSKMLGLPGVSIMIRHLLPVTLPDILVVSSSSFGSMILQISGFSFLGLGIQAPNAEWGMMLNEARSVMFSKPELMLAPGIAIVLVVSAVNFLSDSFQRMLDPRLMSSRPIRLKQGFSISTRLKEREVA
ncbi:peptide ABC transporter permease [Paenibacillus oryzae]|uniref:Peptide ABC transporter permease n=1 Tax=Paenibacillus oryzae TaxID=1844972 RepID=A0A1A5YDS9_9BACL|nr:nickel/cobalt ABC transporter permease [Paenibacillus oryzae]OBR63743.1 peptide ABC transporter permease [Paenibacillus oryzae]